MPTHHRIAARLITLALGVVPLASAVPPPVAAVEPPVVDATPPQGTVSIQGGRAFHNRTAVSVGVPATDDSGAVEWVELSNDGTAWTRFAYATPLSWTLAATAPDGSTGDGPRQVLARWADAVGNVSEPRADTITLDTRAPTGSASINGGATYTKSAGVTLSLQAKDGPGGSGATRVRISNSSATSGGLLSRSWTVALAPTAFWAMSLTSTGGTGANGLRSVYLQWGDGAGNWSTVLRRTITLDTRRPSRTAPLQALRSGGVLNSDGIPLRLTWTSSDATSGVAQHVIGHSTDEVSYSPVATTNSATTTADLRVASGEQHRFRLRAADRAGNEAFGYGLRFDARIVAETNTNITYAGSWAPGNSSNFQGDQATTSSTPGDAARYTFSGSSIGLVASLGPTRGTAEITVDGVFASTVSLRSSAAQHRKLVFTREWPATGAHTIEIRVAEGPDAGSVLLDGFVVLDSRSSNLLPEEPATRPNIVLIMVDDLAPMDGRLWPFLPNIYQTFVKDGVTFSDFHGETPLCCPGRAGFLSGLHTTNHGVIENRARLFDDRTTIASELQEVGYHTIMDGKYLNFYSELAPAIPSGWEDFSAMGATDYYGAEFWTNGSPTHELYGRAAADYSTDVVRRKALTDLREAPLDRPLFAWVSVWGPHAATIPAPRHLNDSTCESIRPWAPPNYNEEDVSDKPAYVQAAPLLAAPAYDLRATCRTMLSVDELVGAVRSELRAQGRLDDTLFILAGDNGMNFGAHRLLAKSRPYATDLPFFMSWPAGLSASPRTVNERLQNIDFAPTLCEFAGCTMGPYPSGQQRPDGISFVGLLDGSRTTLGRDAVLENVPGGRNPPDWFAVATTDQSPLGRWHYVEYDTGERELYDVSNGPCYDWQEGMAGDPCELDNLADDPAYAEIQAALAARLAELKEEGRPAP